MKKVFFVAFALLLTHFCFAQNIDNKKDMNTERFSRGWEKLKEIDGEVGEKVINSLKDIAPDLGTYIIEYSFGDIYSREGLDLKSKEIAVVAALVAMGNAEPQLKVHLNGALNTGSSVNEVIEVILQMSSYAGFPKAINAMNALKEVLQERQQHGIKDKTGDSPSQKKTKNRLKLGEQELAKLAPNQADILRQNFDNLAPDLVKYILEFGYADIYSRDNLDIKHRQIATISALAAMGNAQPQLRFHIKAGLNIGLSQENIKEVMYLMTIYAGFPSAINGMNILKEVINDK